MSLKSKEIYNLFGERLSDEIDSRVMKNKTLSFKKKSKATKEYLNYLYQHIASSIFKHYAHIASTMRQTYRGKDTTFWEIFRFLKSNISLDLLFFGCSFCNFWLLANIFLFLQNN